MSANNYIRIEKTKNGYEVSHRDYDTDKVSGGSFGFDTAEQALEGANIIEDKLNNDLIGVEYGIRYVNKFKKGR